MARLTADWNPLGRDVFYRKFEIYAMAWSPHVDIGNYVVAPATFGGPIALIRDEKKIVKAHGASVKPIILIFSPVGNQIGAVKCNSNPIVRMGWSDQEELLIVQDDGLVQVYSIFGVFQRSFSMGQDVKMSKIHDCKIFSSYNGTGIAILTTMSCFYVVNNIQDPKSRRIGDIHSDCLHSNCWAVVSEDRLTEIMLVHKNEVLIVSPAASQPKRMPVPEFTSPKSLIIAMALSFNAKQLALLTDDGFLWIGSADIERRFCEFNVKITTPPSQLVWSGNSAAVISWDNQLLVVGVNGCSINYYLDSPVCLLQELDGVRIISNYTHEFLQKVPGVVVNIFKIGSMEPGAILLEASKEFQKKSHRADDYLRTIKGQMEDGITQCIQAAGQEYLPSTQKMLLRAASFGKGFIPQMDPQQFVRMCKDIRVLNMIRDFSVAIPLTFAQLERLTMAVVIHRLVLRQHYCLAIRICHYLGIPDVEGASQIYTHWANHKVMQSHLDEEQVANAINSKVGCTPGVSYSEIADYATANGKKKIAIKLLDFEPQASKQVPLLMKLGQDEQAISKAVESGDTDLIHSVILSMHKNQPQQDFFKMIHSFPVAYTLYQKYCRTVQDNQRALDDLYYQDDNFQARCSLQIKESYGIQNLDERIAALKSSMSTFKNSRNEFLLVHTEEQIKLLTFQRQLESKFGNKYVDKSLHETVYALLLERQNKLAEELKKTFKVSDKRFCWVKIQALAEINDYIELEKVGKKSPIGYEPFVDVCLKQKNQFEARKYLIKVQTANKIKYYAKCGLIEEAGKFALEQKDEQGLVYLLSKCPVGNKQLIEKITNMKFQLTVKR